MASTSTTAIAGPENNRLNKAWTDYVDSKAVNGRFPYKKSFISVQTLMEYNFVDCLRSDATIWVNTCRDYGQVMKNFISKKCEEDDHFLMDLLSYLSNKSGEDIGKLSLWECWPGQAQQTPLSEIFSPSCLLREINNPSLRKALFVITFQSGYVVRSIIAKRLFDAIRSLTSSEREDDKHLYQISLVRYFSHFLTEDLDEWKTRFSSLASHTISRHAHSTSPEIRYVGSYLCSILEIYKKSHEDKDEQLFIPKENIESIRKLLETISQLANAASTTVRSEGASGDASLLAIRIDKTLEQTQDIQWPENAPEEYDPHDFKCPESVKDPSAEDKGRAHTEDQSGEEKTKEQNVSNQGNSKLSQIAIGIIVGLVMAYLLFGRRFKSSNLAPESLSSVSADLLKGKVQSR